MFSRAGAPLNHSPITIQLFQSAEDISEGLVCHSRSVQAIWRLLSRSSHLIQQVQSLFQAISSTILSDDVISSVGPNPQVFSQDLT